jgi:hypothetical protein
VTQDFNESPNPGWGLPATLKIMAAIIVMVIAGGAILLVLDIISLDMFKILSYRTLLVGGVLLMAGWVLGLLARSK